MAMFIRLSIEQAEHVRGPSIATPSAALEPIERQGDAFILGIGVLTDTAHAAHWEYIALLPRLDDTDPAFPGEVA